MNQAIKSPDAVGAAGAYSNTFKRNTTLLPMPSAIEHNGHAMLRIAACHWNQCPTERREMYVQFLQIHKDRADIQNWTAMTFEEFEHAWQVLIFGAIACRCSDLFHIMVKRGII